MSFNNKQEFPSRYKQNRYEDNVKKVKQFITKVVDQLVLIALLIAIAIAYYPIYKAFAQSEPVVELKATESVEEIKRIVRLEVIKPEPTQQDILDEINRVFPDAPIMVSVAYCEGSEDGELSTDVVNPTNGSNDTGIFQISELYHEKEYTRLRLDMTDYRDNIAFARILYDRSGLQPWSASEHCWSK